MIQLTADNFDEEVKEGKTLIDFWAPWCGPCRMQSPILEQLEASGAAVKICKVNVDEQPDLAKRFGILSIPTLILMQNGVLKDKQVGLTSLDELNEFIT
ncbi:MAG: thioredoxin [Firmicutes bacterium CAG:552_39_19]|nr:MAG: thioredoxin [Firmicutes bacterium CAG:552_39_19]